MLGSTGLLLFLVAALLLFGPDKLPDIARSIGSMIGDFRRAMREAEDQISTSEIKESIEETINMAKID